MCINVSEFSKALRLRRTSEDLGTFIQRKLFTPCLPNTKVCSKVSRSLAQFTQANFIAVRPSIVAPIGTEDSTPTLSRLADLKELKHERSGRAVTSGEYSRGGDRGQDTMANSEVSAC